MKIAMVGIGLTGSGLIDWSDGIFTAYDDTSKGGDFSVVLDSEDYIWNQDYDLVVFMWDADDTSSCIKVIKEASALQKQKRPFALFVYVGSYTEALLNSKVIKEIFPRAHLIETDLEEPHWDVGEDIIFVPWAQKVDRFLAVQKRLHKMLAEAACQVSKEIRTSGEGEWLRVS